MSNSRLNVERKKISSWEPQHREVDAADRDGAVEEVADVVVFADGERERECAMSRRSVEPYAASRTILPYLS